MNKNKRIIATVLLNLIYVVYESQISGNIRIDLLVIFPFLLLCYLGLWWKPLKWKAILLSATLTGFNYLIMIYSFDLFDKHPG